MIGVIVARPVFDFTRPFSFPFIFPHFFFFFGGDDEKLVAILFANGSAIADFWLVR